MSWADPFPRSDPKARLQFGSLAEELAERRKDLDLVTGDISTLQSDVATLQTDVATLQGDVSTLQGDVSTLQTDVSGLQSQVDGSHNLRCYNNQNISVPYGTMTYLSFPSVYSDTDSILETTNYRLVTFQTAGWWAITCRCAFNSTNATAPGSGAFIRANVPVYGTRDVQFTRSTATAVCSFVQYMQVGYTLSFQVFQVGSATTQTVGAYKAYLQLVWLRA